MERGSVLPADLASGSYELRDLTNTGVGNLFEGKITYDKTYGHVTYRCGMCCGYSNALLDLNPLGIPFGDLAGNTVSAQDGCSGIFNDVSSFFYNNWRTTNTSIATVDAYGTHRGVAVGSTTSSTSGYLEKPAAQGGPSCPTKNFVPSGGDSVRQVYQVEPIATAAQGQDGTNGLPSCATLGGPSGSRGWVRNVTNQVQYSDSTPVAVSGITVTDTLSIATPNGLGMSGTKTGSFPTTGDGSFPDTYFGCSTVCFGSSATASASQSWTWNGLGLPHTNGIVYSCSSITIDGR